jgi:TonB family protein
MALPILAVALSMFLARDVAGRPTGDLAEAKTLYASGAYEEALTSLTTPKADDSADEVDEYRALCLLALGRTAEVQKSLETLVRRSPLFKMSEAEVSPRLVTTFHDVRKRVLPIVVRDLYTSAKAGFEKNDYDAAKAQFDELSTLLADDDLADQEASMSDLKMLAEGFLKLADVQIAAKTAAVAKPAVPTPTPRAADDKSAGSPDADRIYSSDDKDVTPPVDVNCPAPEWRPSNITQQREFRGVLRVIINAQGKVESSTFVVSANPAYDPLMLAAVRDWQYKPATRNGVTVKYVKLIPVVLKPRESGR